MENLTLAQLPVYTEKTVPSPGWYWHVPTGGVRSCRPRFVELEQDNLDGDLHCRQSQGKYVGPIVIPPHLQA